MKFIDEARILVKSGKGGNGGLSFRREAHIPMGGPDGGNGGRGGHIIFMASHHLNTLIDFRFKQHYYARNGEQGKGKNRNGKSAEDVILKVPVGTQIFSEEGLLLADLASDSQEVIIAKGGKGGLGNSAYKSSTNQAPRSFQPGEEGEELTIMLKLKVISDVGIIGFPNAGKSTLISKLSKAHPKIADYPFTTLRPHLGVVSYDYNSFVMADIPGLIEGASDGVGLGHKFLKHVERCKILVHLIDISSDDIVADYRTIRKELENYSKILSEKLEIIVFSKCDLVLEEEQEEKLKQFKKEIKQDVTLISSVARTNLEALKQKIIKQLSEFAEEE